MCSIKEWTHFFVPKFIFSMPRIIVYSASKLQDLSNLMRLYFTVIPSCITAKQDVSVCLCKDVGRFRVICAQLVNNAGLM
jgi:hypothetical protein